MTVARVALTELKRLTQGKLPKIVLALMCIIPLLYSSIYLYGNWDPYNKMDDVKGALVMLDAGATKDDGTQMNSGQDIKDELLEKNNFDWQTVDTKDEAVNGVTDGTYDFALVIDADFSKNLLSSGAFKPDENGNTGTIDPQQAGLEIITNDANNFVLTNIVKSAGTTIRDNVASQVGDETANELLASFTTIHNKMAEASDGASQLADGTGELSDGTNTLKDGTVKLSDGTVTLSDGTKTLSDGANQLVDGQQQLADGANQLSSGASDLASGAASANDGAQQLSSGASDLASGAASANDGAQQLSSGADTLATGAASADEGAKKLADGASTLNEKMGEAAIGAGDLASGANTLNEGASTLKDGTQQLADGASALAAGTTTLSDGADKVSSGASSLSDGATKLASGTSELNTTVQNSGLTKLADGLSQVCKDLSQTNTSQASGDFGTDLSNTVVSDIATKTKENLAPLVAAGTLTQEQADQIVAQISSDETKSAVSSRSDEALKRLREGALSGQAGSAAADLAAMSAQLDTLKSSSCATTGDSSVADQLNTLVGAISSVNDGAQQLSTGATSLKDGAASVASGAQTVEENTAKLSDGATSVNNGVDSLKSGTEALATGATKLADGTTQLADGTQTLSDGSNTLADGTGQLADGSSTLADGSKTLADGTSQLADGSNTLSDGSKTLADGTGKLADGSNTLKDGADTLASGEATALDGQKSLADGAGQVNDGATSLQSGAAELDSGASDLQSGASQVNDGANELSDGIADGTKQVPSLSTEDQNNIASTMSDPVNLDHVSLANGKNYGEGMGPYFMVLSLWIGMLMLVQTLRPMNTRALASNAPSLRVILGSWAPFAFIGLIQAMLVYAIVAGALGFNFVHPVLAFFFLCFVSFTYSAIIHGLVIFFGSPGKAIALVLLIIQLVTSGGTMPYETLPNSIRWLHSILPMGYALSGIRRIAYGIDLGGILPQILVLLVWLFAGLTLGFIGTARDRVWNLRALNPEIIV